VSDVAHGPLVIIVLILCTYAIRCFCLFSVVTCTCTYMMDYPFEIMKGILRYPFFKNQLCVYLVVVQGPVNQNQIALRLHRHTG
jgi:hypothetical protein